MAKRRPTYKEKIISDAGNEIRVYSKRQVALRNSKKAKRLEELRRNHGRMMRQVRKDLASSDERKRAQAVAIAIADETGARIGNPTSLAERGHKGITTWTAGDVRAKGGGFRVRYTGKSGVNQDHVISRTKTVSALKKMMKGGKGRAVNVGGSPISASSVNDYLRPFDITVKDLRGLKANEDMQAQLRRRRNRGRSLPHPVKERTPILREEFKSALDHVAGDLGHEPATLRRQYLVPNLEASFMKDGSVPRKMNPPSPSRQKNPVALTDHKPWGTAIQDVAAVPRWAVPNPVPPRRVRATAQDALERRRERAKKTKRPGGTAVGVARARDLSGGKNVSQDTVNRMKSFFARHDTPAERRARKRDAHSPAAIAWDLWGGNPGRAWASRNPPTGSKTVIAYHGSNVPIRKFRRDFGAQGVMWFSEDRDLITGGVSGACSTKWIMTVELTIGESAGWHEYDKLALAQIEDEGYDSIHLDDNWIMFDPNRVKVIGVEANTCQNPPGGESRFDPWRGFTADMIADARREKFVWSATLTRRHEMVVDSTGSGPRHIMKNLYSDISSPTEGGLRRQIGDMESRGYTLVRIHKPSRPRHGNPPSPAESAAPNPPSQRIAALAKRRLK